MKLTFLSAAMPLVKSITRLKDGTIEKSDYPNAKNFTSTEIEVKTPKDLYTALSTQSTDPKSPCLLTGPLERPLINEPRKGMVDKVHKTQLLTLDLDKAPFTSPEEFLRAVQLDKISYVWQYSSSAKLNPKDKHLSGHIFMLIDKPVAPRTIKAWLTNLNLSTDVLKRHVTLAKAKQTLHYPLDIVVNDNGRIVFIATPKFKGMEDPLKGKARVELVPKVENFISADTMGERAPEILRKEITTLRNELRKKEGLEPITKKIKIVKDFEVQEGVGEVASYSHYDDGEYIRYNLNGGDSNAYWHHKTNFEYLHSFKGEPSVLMKEVMPDRYRDLVGERKDASQTQSATGDTVLCFREKRTAEYWKGLYNEETQHIEIHKVKSKDQLIDYYLSHQAAPPDYIQEFEMSFNPQSTAPLVDFDNRTINKFVMPKLLRTHTTGAYPIIQKCINSAVGTGPIQEHFLNWLAVIFQHRTKTNTAWVLHGTQGTGKGVLFDRILGPALKGYVAQINAGSLKSDFLSFHEHKLISLIDEIDVDMFEKKSLIESVLKNMITDPQDKIHRKGVDLYETPSFHNMIFGSNKNQPVRIPANDRRFNVGQFQHKRWIPTVKEVEIDIAKELPHFVNYMMTRTACRNTAAQIMQTEERAAIQQLSITSVDEFANDITSGNLEKLFELLPDEKVLNENGIINPAANAYIYMLRRFINEDRSNLSRDELALMFTHAIGKVPEGANKFTSFLKHHGIVTKKIRVDGLATYGIQVDWKISKEERAELLRSLNPSQQKLRKVK